LGTTLGRACSRGYRERGVRSKVGWLAGSRDSHRVAGPRVLRFAPFVDCSTLDTLRFPPRPDCSVSGFARPMLSTGLRRHSTLDAPCLPQIAPLPTLHARAVGGLLRCAALRAFAPLTDCSVLDAWRSEQPADCSAKPFFPLCAGCELLRARHLTFHDGLRIAPYAITFRPCTVHGLLRAQCFKLRIENRLLGVRHLTFARVADCSASLALRPVQAANCFAACT